MYIQVVNNLLLLIIDNTRILMYPKISKVSLGNPHTPSQFKLNMCKPSGC